MKDQINIRLNLRDPRNQAVAKYINERDRRKFPTVREYIFSAVEALEAAERLGAESSILSAYDVRLIEQIVLRSLREYEESKIREMMAP